MPQVSVVVPAYNAERFLARTVESVRAQTFSSWELIVVDDGSSDATSAIARQSAAGDERITLHQQTNAGVAAARNAGLSVASANACAIMFLDADDVLDPAAVEILYTLLGAHPTAVGVHGQARFIASDGLSIRQGEAEAWGRDRHALVDGRIVDWPVHLPTTLGVFVLGNRVITPGCVLLRRQPVQSVGGFDQDPGATAAEDYGLWLRLACLGDFLFVDQTIVSYRIHDRNASNNLTRMDAARWHIQRKLANSPEITGEQRRHITLGLRYARLLGGKERLKWARQSMARGDIVAAGSQARRALVDFLQFCLDGRRSLPARHCWR
jgi:glycosyltransferase involved in cell wall biosynthesis